MNPNITVVNDVLKKYPHRPSSLIMVLQDIQAKLKYLPNDVIDVISKKLEVPKAEVFSVVTFYNSFNLKKQGKHIVDICIGTACHVRGAGQLVDYLSKELEIKPGETTKDGEFTLNTVHCVGACALAPVVVIDGEYYGKMTPTKISKIIKEIRENKNQGKISTKDKISSDKQDVPVKINSSEELNKLRDKISRENPAENNEILVCAGTGCIAGGGLKVAKAISEEIIKQNVEAEVKLSVKETGCHGFCEQGPLVVFYPSGIYYTKVTPKDAKNIVEKTVLKGEVIDKLLYKDPNNKQSIKNYKQIPFYSKQNRMVLGNIGRINPEDINDYLINDGYKAMQKVLTSNKPMEVITEVEKSGLRGRGGGGFSTGRKWNSCVKAAGKNRYVICNGDEGDPGAFMDRSIMEGDPHAVIEGMIIGAYAVGAKEGYIYVREEYPLAVSRIVKAIKDAEDIGLLGKNILGSDFSFQIKINRGGGAFVCGESSALMKSIEGKSGEPRAKYIRSVERGLNDQPTVLNNVETFANIPIIILQGAEKFATVGTKTSSGTKAFAVVGKVKNTGLVEVPMGTTLRSIIFEICGGIIGDRKFKAVQTGGPSGGCLPENMLDLPVDFDSLTKEGSMMGSGGMIVMDEDTCMVDVAKYFIQFLSHESCGKCSACRLGLAGLLEILERICKGKGELQDMDKIEQLLDVLEDGALCGLGKSASNPVRSTIKYFKDEYESHIKEKRCPGGVCKELIHYKVNSKCIGCMACKKACPQNAISGERKEKHLIDLKICDKCGICISTCKFEAIEICK